MSLKILKNEKRDIVVYTDGSYKKNGKHIKCGYGVYFPNGEMKDLGRPFTRKPLTSQRAELYAIYKALKRITKILEFNSIHIYTDSEYSIKSLTIWINTWKSNNWKTANKKEVSNQDIIKKIDKMLQKYPGKILFTHVPSHTGKKDAHSLGNEKADELANLGASKS
jgi:ribonuclease HI